MTISNKDFCHQYAYASNDNQEGHNGNMSYYNGVMLSYNTAIAKKFDNFTLFNRTRYSNTASKQQSYLINALSGKIIYVDGLRQGTRFEKSDIISGLTSCLNWSVANLAKSKRQSTKDRFSAEIHQHFLTLGQLLDYKILAKKDLNKELKALLLKELNPMTVARLVDFEKKKIAKEKKEALKRLEQKRKDFELEIADFKAGNKNNISYGARDLICGGFDIIRLVSRDERLKDEILTSQGILVPLEHALFLFEAAKKQKKLGKSKSDFCFKIRDTFPIDRIEANGDCFVGCHKFKFEEILRCYNEEYKK